MLLLPQAFTPAGGLQMYGKLLIKACSELSAAAETRPQILILRDAPADVDDRYLHGVKPLVFRGSRLRFALAAIRTARKFRPSLLIAAHVNLGPLVFLLRLLSPRKTTWFVTYGVDVWRKLPWYRRFALRSADRVIAISEYTRSAGARANGLDPRRIEIVPCAIDPLWTEQHESVAAVAPVRNKTLLTVARLARSEADKGIDTVLRAVAKVRTQVPDVRYVIAGEGDDRLRLMDLSRDLGIATNVEFRGYISSDELARAYRDCALFVMPSRKEGFGIVYLEAAFFGKPSVAANEGGAPEVVIAETGRTVRFGDVEGLANVLTELLTHPDQLANMGAHARKRARETFSYPKFRDRLQALMAASEQVPA